MHPKEMRLGSKYNCYVLVSLIYSVRGKGKTKLEDEFFTTSFYKIDAVGLLVCTLQRSQEYFMVRGIEFVHVPLVGEFIFSFIDQFIYNVSGKRLVSMK